MRSRIQTPSNWRHRTWRVLAVASCVVLQASAALAEDVGIFVQDNILYSFDLDPENEELSPRPLGTVDGIGDPLGLLAANERTIYAIRNRSLE